MSVAGIIIGVLSVLVIIYVIARLILIIGLKSAKTEDNLEKYYKDEFGEL